jgi:hypothetical protein
VARANADKSAAYRNAARDNGHVLRIRIPRAAVAALFETPSVEGVVDGD